MGAGADLKRIDRELVRQCEAKAKASADDYNTQLIAAIKTRLTDSGRKRSNISTTDRDYLNLYLFGRSMGGFATIGKGGKVTVDLQ